MSVSKNTLLSSLYLRTGSNVIGPVFLTEFIDDWIMMKVKTDRLSVNVSISDLISTAADAAGALILNSEANCQFLSAERIWHKRCASICNLVSRSMHAPTIMTLTEVMLKISRSFPSERNRICKSLQRNNDFNGADLAVLHRIIGEERDPFLAFKDASPAAEDVVTLVDCAHSRIRGKVVWGDVTHLKLGKRTVSAKSPSNTIFATELGLWFTCAEDEGDDARCVRACINMNAVQSVQIDTSDTSTCAISLLSALDSFGDVSIETATSTVYVVLKNSSEAHAFIVDLQNKLDLFKGLDEFSRRSAVRSIPVFDIRGKTVDEIRQKKHWGASTARNKKRRIDVADEREAAKNLAQSPNAAEIDYEYDPSFGAMQSPEPLLNAQTSPAVTAVPSNSHAVNPTKLYAGNSPGFNYSVTLFGSNTLTFITAAATIVKGEVLKSATSSPGTASHLNQLRRTLPLSFASRINDSMCKDIFGRKLSGQQI
jgi:hypothetical protein